jgi:hypothetical protein
MPGIRRPIILLVFLSGSAALFASVIIFATRVRGSTVVLGQPWPADQRLSISDIDHAGWTDLLRRYVDQQGKVDYGGWTQSAADVRDLDEYLNRLSLADPDRLTSRAERLAFWINAYNALTVRGILREYPTTSIQNHVSRVGGYNIWRDLLLLVGGKPYSLGEIEYDVLRGMSEPRIHFAIVCASCGCPRLLDEAYDPATLEQQLAGNTRAFFAYPTKIAYEDQTKTISISPIFKWYASDFGSDQAEQLQTVSQYLPTDEAHRIVSDGAPRLRFLDYDWSLNEQTSAPPLPRSE